MAQRPQRSIRLHPYSSGFSLVEVMIALAISGGVILAMTQISLMMTKQQSQTVMTSQLSMLHNSIVQSLNSAGGWTKTIGDADNNQPVPGGPVDNMACLRDPSKFCDNAGAPNTRMGVARVVVLKDAGDSEILNMADPSAGLTMSGQKCTGFVPMPGTLGYSAAAPGNDSCPLRYEITWRAQCDPTGSPVVPCNNTPAAKVTVTLYYHPGDTSKMVGFNPDNYSSSFTQGSTGTDCWTYSAGTLYETCGNVGIGTTSPISPLSLVSPLADATAPSPLISLANSANNRYSAAIGSHHITGVGQRLDFYAGDSGANGIAQPGSNIRMSITAAGNVGIGTSSPVSQLSNYGAAGFPQDSATLGVTSARGLTWNNNTGSGYSVGFGNLSTGAAANGLLVKTSNDSDSAKILTLNGGGADQFVVLGSGKVGIGVTSPPEMLSIASSGMTIAKVQIQNTKIDATGVGVFQAKNSVGDDIEILSYGTLAPGLYLGASRAGGAFLGATPNLLMGVGTKNSKPLMLATNSTERLRIDEFGKVGIGTNEPKSVLHVGPGAVGVLPAAGVSLFVPSTDVEIRHLLIGYGTSQAKIMTDDGTKPISFIIGGSEYIRITNAGNVGIGTTSPAALLHSYKASGTNTLRIQSGTDSVDISHDGSTAFITNNRAAGTLSLSTTSSGVINYFTNSLERMRISDNGNVGIGTTTPTYQLQLSTDSAAKPGTSTWTIASDERLKDIRAPFTRSLDALVGLHTIYFNYRPDNPLSLPSDKEFVGVKAQDVQKVIPEAVSTDAQGYLHVTNDSIIWTAINAIKELYQKLLGHDAQLATINSEKLAQDREIASLKAQNEKLRQDNAAIKSRLDQIEKLLNAK